MLSNASLDRYCFVRMAMTLCIFLALLGCGASTTSQPRVADTPIADFSGHWEVDYARSDSVQTQLNSTFRDIQRQARRQRDAAERGVTYQGPPLGDVETILALAKMAELVTASDLLVVHQDTAFVRIDRENSFALVCDIRDGQSSVTQLGQETCWWDGQQLHFYIELPEGLSIRHRFVRSADGALLAQRTRLTTRGTQRDFEVSRIFARFEPGNRGYQCINTLSRGRVCSTERTPSDTPL
jgi:hypothetical protein